MAEVDKPKAGSMEATLSSIAEDMAAMRRNMESLTTTVNGLESKIMSKIRGVIKDEVKTFNNEIELLKGRMDQMESKMIGTLNVSAAPQTDVFDVNKSVILINMAQHDQEDTALLCTNLFTDVLNVDVEVTQAERTRRKDPNRPAVIKCQLNSVADKILVLRNKLKVKDNPDTEQVYIAKMKSHEERLIELNFRSILRELPNGNHFRITGSGRVVDKRDQAANGGGASRDPSAEENPSVGENGPPSRQSNRQQEPPMEPRRSERNANNQGSNDNGD